MKRIPTLSPRQNLIVAAAVRAVADEAMEDKLARRIAARTGRLPDDERLLFAIVDGLEDYKLTAPSFVRDGRSGCSVRVKSPGGPSALYRREKSVLTQRTAWETFRSMCRPTSGAARTRFWLAQNIEKLRIATSPVKTAHNAARRLSPYFCGARNRRCASRSAALGVAANSRALRLAFHALPPLLGSGNRGVNALSPPKVDIDGVGDFSADVPLYVELG
jgi:hypothetical protein